MDEYIRKDDILQMIESDAMWNLSFGILYDDIQNMPHADVAPVRHGRWKPYPDCGVTRCSLCDWSIEECIDYNYCPNCGAKMDGDE